MKALREYTFLRSDQRILRVFGPTHPAGSFWTLLRYYREKGQWHKPPRHAAEYNESAALQRYGGPTAPVPPHMIRLEALSFERIDETFEPTIAFRSALLAANGRVAEALETLQEFTERWSRRGVDVEIGIVGSHLVGLERPCSDLDCVIYGSFTAESVEMAFGELDAMPGIAVAWPPPGGSTMERFETLSLKRAASRSRDVFTRTVAGTKVDFHYAQPMNVTNREHRHEVSLESVPGLATGRVISTKLRHLYPVMSRVAFGQGLPEHAVFRDHAARYLRDDDTVTVRASILRADRNCQGCFGTEGILVVDKVVRVTIGRIPDPD